MAQGTSAYFRSERCTIRFIERGLDAPNYACYEISDAQSDKIMPAQRAVLDM